MEAWLLVVWCGTCTPAQYVANIEPYVRLDACLATRNEVAGIRRWQDCDKAPIAPISCMAEPHTLTLPGRHKPYCLSTTLAEQAGH
jgi:hypothetical protein